MRDDLSLLARRARVLGPAYRLFYDRPLHLVRGAGARVWDADGREYLDAYNNVPSVGHCHPKVVEALSTQSAALNSHTRYLHETVVEYAEQLVAHFPDPLSQIMFTCTGSEANDLALRVARSVTGSTGIIVTQNAYHGVTAQLAEMSPSLGDANPIGTHVRMVPTPDTYRLGKAGAEKAFFKGVLDAMSDLEDKGFGVAALICDTVFASDGLFIDPRGLIKRSVVAVQSYGGLFIADEVQSGFARLGEHMWAFQRHDVVPDMVTLGKPMGAGHPIAALVSKPDLLEAFGNSTRYFNTFAGNPVSAAIGQAVLNVIDDEDLMGNARRVGADLHDQLNGLASRHRHIGDVRGQGLYVAVELVSERQTMKPWPEGVNRLLNLLREDGVLAGSCGQFSNCLKIRPPLCFTRDDSAQFVDVLNRNLSKL